MGNRVFESGQPIYIRDLFKILESVNEDVNLCFNENGLTIMVMDPRHVAMLDLDLPSSNFDSYWVEEPFTLSVNLAEVSKALKKVAKRDHSLTFERGEDRVTFKLRSDITRCKTLRTLETPEEEIPMPKLFHKSVTRLILKTLKRILDDFKGSPHLTIRATQDEIEFSVSSDILDESTPLRRDNDNILEHRTEEDTRSVYSMPYLTDFINAATRISEVATLSFAEDMPIRIDVEIPQGHLIYYVAPCIGV